MENSENKASRTKATRILYIVIAGVLCVSAAVAGIAFSMGVFDPAEPEPVTPVVTPPVVDTDSLPVFIAPAAGVISKNHDLSVLVHSATLNHWRVHRGIDITAASGDPVYASADGTVESVYSDPLLGQCIRITHSGDAVTVYCNLKDTVADGISAGVYVTAGQLIGCVGESAMSELADEPHLHFEMQVAGVPVDPLQYLSSESQNASFSLEDQAYEG